MLKKLLNFFTSFFKESSRFSDKDFFGCTSVAEVEERIRQIERRESSSIFSK